MEAEQLERMLPGSIDWAFVIAELGRRGMTVAPKCYVTEPRVQKAQYELCKNCQEVTVQYIHEKTVICRTCRWYSIDGGKQIDPDPAKSNMVR